MSSHVLDVSGARPLTTTTNDPASTRIWMPAKAGDDVAVTLGGFRELRFELPDTARIQRRRYVRNEVVHENGRPKPNPDPEADANHPYETRPVEYERTVLVVQGIVGFGRSSLTPEESAASTPSGERKIHEGHPSTQVIAKRQPDLHVLEEGILVSEQTLGEAIADGLFPGLGVTAWTAGPESQP